MEKWRRARLGALIGASALMGSLLVAPPASASTTCLKNNAGYPMPVETLWSQEDRYTNNAGKIWIEYKGVNRCDRTIQGWEFRLEIIDAFGDNFYRGSGKVWLKKPVAPGKSFKANRKGGFGVFSLYGSTWKNFEDWKRQRADSPSGPAHWRYTVVKIV